MEMSHCRKNKRLRDGVRTFYRGIYFIKSERVNNSNSNNDLILFSFSREKKSSTSTDEYRFYACKSYEEHAINFGAGFFLSLLR